MLGYSQAEILASHDIRELVYKEDVPMAMKAVEDAIAKESAINIIYRCVSKEGKVFLTRLNAKVMSDKEISDDEIAVLYAVHSRLSDESRQAIQEQKYYRMILNMTGTAYFEWDKVNGFYASEDYGKYALSNGGYNAVMGSLEGQEAIHPEDMAALRYFTRQTGLPESAKSITVRMKMQDGHYQWTEVRSYAERDEEGNFTKLVGVLRDVDKEWVEQNRKLQAALDAAQQANRAKTAFLSRVSHDMRTPLNGILGLTSFLKDAVTDKQAAKDISQLELSGQYLLNLVNDTLDVGRIEQIIMNIVGNAVKFTDEGGTIACSLEQMEETERTITHRIAIRDNGIGMSKEFIPAIFDAFSQADDTRTNARQGTGLGMAITKQLVDLMGGIIHVESELGKGSCFTIVIPFNKATKEQSAARKASLSKEANDSILQGKHILVCEDHPLNREIAIRLLENKGMMVMDGLDATRAIRELSRKDALTVPIIAMTGNSFEEDVAKTLDAGMNAHLSKPIDSVKLFDTLRDQLRNPHYYHRKKVLVVDDTELNRAVILAAIESDYETAQASDGREALAILSKDREFDAVITDIMMPNMDGFELIKWIRENRMYDRIAILANTQYGEMTQEKKLKALGANAFIYKPNTPEDVTQKLRKALQLKELEAGFWDFHAENFDKPETLFATKVQK